MSDESHVSVTQIRTCLRCSLQYLFRYVCDLVVPPTGDLPFGRTVHEGLQENSRQKIRNQQDLPARQAREIFSDSWDRQVQETVFGEDEKPGQFKEQGVRLLTAYIAEVAPNVQPVEVERELLLETGATELPLKGYIDLIDDQGYIIDHKTSKRSFPPHTVEKDLQLTACAFAYRSLCGQPGRGVRLDVMVRTKQPRLQQLQAGRT